MLRIVHPPRLNVSAGTSNFTKRGMALCVPSALNLLSPSTVRASWYPVTRNGVLPSHIRTRVTAARSRSSA